MKTLKERMTTIQEIQSAGSGPLDTTRRRLLQAGGALVVSFSLAPGAEAAARPAAKTTAADQADGFLAIDAQGKITVFSGKVDLGTGVRTAITQIVAEELSVPMADVSVIQGDTALRGQPSAACRSRMAACRSGAPRPPRAMP